MAVERGIVYKFSWICIVMKQLFMAPVEYGVVAQAVLVSELDLFLVAPMGAL